MRGLAAWLWTLALWGQTGAVRMPKMTDADIASGAKTFRSHCAECHGIKGEGGRGPNLAEGNYFHGSTDADLLKNISDGIAGTEMPGLFYSPDRVWQVVAFLRALNEKSQARATGDAAAGRQLYLSSGCRDCHRVAGDGGRVGPDLTNIGKIRSAQHLRDALTDPNADVRQRYWVVDLVTGEGKNLSGFLMEEDTYSIRFIDLAGQLHSVVKQPLKSLKVEKTSKMPSYKDRFNQKQMDDLVAYLASLRPAKGGER